MLCMKTKMHHPESISKLVPRTSKLKLEYNIVAFPYVQHYFLQSVLVPSNLFFDCCVSLQCFLINSFDLLSLSPFCFSVPVIFLIRTPLQWRTQSQFEKGQVSFTALQSLEMNPLVELLFLTGTWAKTGEGECRSHDFKTKPCVEYVEV